MWYRGRRYGNQDRAGGDVVEPQINDTSVDFRSNRYRRRSRWWYRGRAVNEMSCSTGRRARIGVAPAKRTAPVTPSVGNLGLSGLPSAAGVESTR